MNKSFFSVIVPSHNGAEYIRKGLDSIKAQTFKNYELIITCDACEDNTAEIAREYTDKVFEIDAHRCGLARNKGLDNAEGEWILFMDDDDWFSTELAFEVIANAIRKIEDQQQPMDILAFGFEWPGYGIRYNTPQRLYTAVWNKAWRKEFIDRIGARFPDWIHSDDDGFSRITHHRANIKYLDGSLYYYNFMRPGSLTWQMDNGLMEKSIPAEL